MPIFALLFVLFALPLDNARADSLGFDCRPHYAPEEQGTERYLKIDFREAGRVGLQVASLASPFEPLDAGLALRSAGYTNQDSHASAFWSNAAGDSVVWVSLVYFGSWWGGHLEFNQPVKTASLSFAAGESFDLRCFERKATP